MPGCKQLADKLTQSENDPKEYRVIRLENGLTALLISDKEDGVVPPANPGDGDTAKKGEKLAAAALCIGVGSFSDPTDLPGLAHFTEHMVFMGSEKYPNENEFDEFVKKHGGYNNAFTECEHTVFYFNIEKGALYKGMDIFSGFFSKPLLKQDSVDREIKAVDSEFSMSKPSDSVRHEQIFGSLAKDGHPMGKFMWGNVESLKETPAKQGIDSYTRLREFHKQSYSAQYMTLAVQAMYPLDQLEEWVVEIFSAVPNNRLPRPIFVHLNEPFNTDKFNKLYKVIPCKNEHKLFVTWSLPSLLNQYQSKPLSYLDFLVGHEGTGSLMAYLRKRMWSVELSAGNSDCGFDHNQTHAVFKVEIKLTELGLENVNKVMLAVLQYVEMVRREGPKQWIFDEIKSIQHNDFRWMESEDPVDNVETLCSNMLRYPPTDYISGQKLVTKYDPKWISQCLDQMVPQKANFYIQSKKFADQKICNLKEKWYKTEYCVEEIPEEVTSKWANIEVDPSLHLPASNPYIATDFTLKPPTNPTEYPVTITDNNQSRLYFKQDTKFKTPKAHVSFFLISPVVKKSAESRCMLDVFLEILNHQMSETAYAASVASLNYQMKRTDHGMTLKVLGFNHKLLKLFETILDFIVKFTVEDDLLQTMITKVQNDLYNTSLKPAKLNKELRLSLLFENETTTVDGMREIHDITVDKITAFVKALTAEVYVEGLIQGNLTHEEAKLYESCLLTRLGCKPIPNKAIPDNRVVSVGVGSTYCRTDNLNKNDENSVITNYYQHGPGSIHQLTLSDLLMMRMEEPCFDVLRTKHQLGYSVYNMNRVTDGVLGFSITVCNQAHKFTLEEVDKYIEDFLQGFVTTLQQDTEDDFNTLRNSLITLKKCLDSNLGEEFSRNWTEIIDRTYTFDILSKQVEVLQKLTLEELRAWYNTFLPSGGNCKKLSVQIEGHKDAVKSSEEDMEEGNEEGEEMGDEDMDDEEEEEDDDEEDEDLGIPLEEFNVKELKLKPIEGKGPETVITNVASWQHNSSFYPASRILN